MKYDRLAVDTNVAVPIINREPEFRHFMRGYHQLCVPVVVLAELRHGILRSKNVAENLQKLEQFVQRCDVL